MKILDSTLKAGDSNGDRELSADVFSGQVIKIPSLGRPDFQAGEGFFNPKRQREIVDVRASLKL